MYKPPETNNPTINTILKRYSLRNFSETPISQDNIDRILEGAMRAPTGGNMMMYSILRITDQAKKEQLVKTCDNQPFIAKSPLVLIFLADMQRWFDYYELSNIKDLCKRTGLEYRLPQESDLLLHVVMRLLQHKML
jgi:FMN reductase (NADPH)